LISIALGLGLAAACGFRVFVPLLVMSAAAYTGHLELAKGFAWIGTLPALITFATATVVEIAAYYIPWVDHLLDTISGPSAVVAGAVVTASALTDVDPFLKWSLAIIGGGGIAGIVSGSTAVVRGFSTVTTGGLGNPIVSTVEAAASFVLSVLAVVLPLVALAVVLLLLLVLVKKLFGGRVRSQAA
jgi:Domain of unknown function (DUF4126)